MTRDAAPDLAKLKHVWEHAFRLLRVDPSHYPVLIAVPPSDDYNAARTLRERLADLFFQQFRVPTLCFMNQCVLSLFATGRTRGLVVELGESATYIVPIFEGLALPHASIRLELAGQDVSAALVRAVHAASPEVQFLPSQAELVRLLKRKQCAVLPTADADPHCMPTIDSAFELPDGRILDVDPDARFSPPEVLFNPPFDAPPRRSSVGAVVTEAIGLPDVILESISKCDNYVQRDLYRNIILSGGTSMLPGAPLNAGPVFH